MVQVFDDLPVDKLYELADALKTAIDALSERIGSSRTREENVADAQRMVDWHNLLYLVEFYIQKKDKPKKDESWTASDAAHTGTATTIAHDEDYD